MTPTASTAYLALSSARSYLNDTNAVTWPDARLFPFLQEAHRELSAKLVANGVAVVRQQTAQILVPALNQVLGQCGPIPLPNTPSNLVFPLSIVEKQTNDDVEFYVDMQQMNFVPLVDPVEELIYWAWIGQQIMLVGATNDVDVILRYRGSLLTPQVITDNLGFIFAENYIGPRIASLAYMSVGNSKWKEFYTQAMDNMDLVIRMNISGNQGVGIRRMAYRRGNLRRIF